MLSGGILTKSRSSPCLESWKSPRSPSETARRRRTGPLPVGLPMFFLNRGASQRAGRPARRPGPSGGGGGEEGGNDGSAVALPNPRLGAHSSGSVFRATAGGSRAASERRRLPRGEQLTHGRAPAPRKSLRRDASAEWKRPQHKTPRRARAPAQATRRSLRNVRRRRSDTAGSEARAHSATVFSPSPIAAAADANESASAALEGQAGLSQLLGVTGDSMRSRRGEEVMRCQ